MQDYPNDQQPIRLPGSVRVVVGGLLVGLLLVSCVAVALIPVLASQQGADAQQERAFQALFAALFALLGLLLLLTERQLRAIGWTRAPVSFGRLMVTTGAGLTFWTGLALFGIALARLEVPDMAGPLNIAFWALAALWLAGEVVLTARHFWRPRRVRAPGRWE